MYAIVDVGSNTVRLNIYDIADGKAKLLFNKKESVGLASYVKNGVMIPAGISKVSEVLCKFKELAEGLKIKEVQVFATAALRNCRNSKEAVADVCQRTGLNVRVISGKMEAELDFVGATQAVGCTSGLLVDIGGGSTELVSYKNGEIVASTSLPLGSLNVYDKYVTNILPDKSERKAIKKAVLEAIETDGTITKGQFDIICGVGGSCRATAKLNKAMYMLEMDDNDIPLGNLRELIRLLERNPEVTMPLETMDLLLRFIPERVRTIMPGMIILHTIAKKFGAKVISVTNSGVRDGYLYSYVMNNQNDNK